MYPDADEVCEIPVPDTVDILIMAADGLVGDDGVRLPAVAAAAGALMALALDSEKTISVCVEICEDIFVPFPRSLFCTIPELEATTFVTKSDGS